MLINLVTIDSVEKFCNLASDLEGQAYVKQGKLCVSANSILGIFSLSLLEPMELEFDGCSQEEIDKFLEDIDKLKIVRK